MAITQKEIAQHVGVSRSTVVQVLNGIGRVNAQTRDRVLLAAKELGYRPNPLAKALVTGKTNTLALWFYPLLGPQQAIIANGLQMLVPPYGLILFNLGLYKPGWDAVTEEFVPGEWPVDGVFAFRCGFVPPHVLERGSGPPVIWIDYDRLPDELEGGEVAGEVDAVLIQTRGASEAAVRHLVKTRKRVAFLAVAPIIEHQSDGRTAAYHDVMREAGRVPEIISVPVDRPFNGRARERIIEYVRQNGCPDAIFCASDEQTPGVHLGLSDMGLRVPEDVALVGFDGLPELEYHVPPLSTILTPFERVCEIAWEFMSNRLSHPDTPRQLAHVEMTFVPRQSSAPTE